MGKWFPKKLMLLTTVKGSLPASSLAHFWESAGLMAMKQVSSWIGRPGLPSDGLLPRPPSSSLMYLVAASTAVVNSGKLPLGSPCGFCMPMTMGSPSAFSGVSAAHWMSAVHWPAFLPSVASMESSGSQGALMPALAAAAAVVVAPPAGGRGGAARRGGGCGGRGGCACCGGGGAARRVVVVAAGRGEQGERSDHDEWLQHS